VSGWWADEPVIWPAEAVLERARIVRAMRLLPLGHRVLLVLRDAANLRPDEAADIIGTTVAQQEVLLESARVGLVAYLDQDITKVSPYEYR
jgi:DNA-directed RNA polymerase specialized sigma24 family protein